MLAVFGLLVCSMFAWWLFSVDAPLWLRVVMVVLAVVAVVDLVVVVGRKRRGEPG